MALISDLARAWTEAEKASIVLPPCPACGSADVIAHWQDAGSVHWPDQHVVTMLSCETAGCVNGPPAEPETYGDLAAAQREWLGL